MFHTIVYTAKYLNDKNEEIVTSFERYCFAEAVDHCHTQKWNLVSLSPPVEYCRNMGAAHKAYNWASNPAPIWSQECRDAYMQGYK